METRAKSNNEFRNEVSEVLARHETGFEDINGKLGNLEDRFGKVDSTL